MTATSPALIQPQVQVTGAEGDYRFIALPPGVYDITFELSGFQTVKREGVRVVINQTLTVDQQLQVATLQETVTVTGAVARSSTPRRRRSAPTSPRNCSPRFRTRATSGRPWRRRPACR